MTNSSESITFKNEPASARQTWGWLRVGAIAVASAAAGGLAAAWYYRRTLTGLRNAENDTENPEIGITEYE